jgi:hypothetical protein
MDHGQFDELTRNVVVNLGARRTLLRFLAGSALGGMAAQLGLSEEAAAKRKRHGKGHEDRKRPGKVHAAGKKHKRKGKRKGKDQPTQPNSCGPGFRPCSGGTCVADKPGICCIDEEFCPGGGCRPQDGCCSEQQNCGGGICVNSNECCPLKPLCEECEEAVCINGDWECRTTCAGGSVCCQDACVPQCSNDCNMSDDCGTCDKAPLGKVYCAGQDRCVPSCGPGKSLDPVSCTCVAWGPVCRPGYQDCRAGDVCCGGRCIACPEGGRCEDKICYGCVGANTVSCPPSPLWPSGFCCPPESGGRPFKYCHPPYEPPHQGWGCYYES